MTKYLYAALCFLVLAATPVLKGATQQPPQAEASPIQLNLENDIRDVIDIIAEALQLNIVVDPAVKGSVKILTSTTLQRSDLLPILETILKLNGATLVKTGNFYQVVLATSAVRQPLGIQERSDAVSPDDQMVLQIIRMQFVAAAEMARLLTPYVAEGGSIVVHDSGNILLITDRRSNLRKLLGIVDVFDTNAFEGGRVRILDAKNTLAKDLVEDLKSVFSGYGLSDKSAIRFLPLDRTNQVLVISPNSAVFPEVEKWFAQLDQPGSAAGIRTFVYKAKHGKAVDLQRVLSQLYSDGTVAPVLGAGPSGPGTPPQPTATTPGLAPVQQGATGPVPVSENSKVRIIADEINNSLLILASPQVIADIERTLRELDVLRRQVLIDAQIYEVALNDATSLGISAILQNRGTLPRSTTGSFATPPAGGQPSLSVQTFAYIGRMRELLLFLNASENRGRIKTVSAPSVLVGDNLEAMFQVGTEVPVPTSSSITPVQNDGTNLFAQTIQFRDTGVILKVKPQINEGGSITLRIDQEVSQASANTTSSIVAPLIGKSSVSSTISVENGQTIALGGFMRENEDLDRQRIPIIGRIPGIGALFGNTTKSHVRSELIILITPHVLESRADADRATEELKTKLKGLADLLK